MKKLFITTIIFCTAIASMAMSSNSKENTHESINIFSSVENSVSVISAPSNLGTLCVKITDHKNNTVFRNYLNSKKGFLQKYDLGNLQPGKYEVTVAKGNEILIRKEVLVHYANFKLQDLGNDKFEITYTNTGTESVKLSILDNNNEQIGTKEINPRETFTKTYDFSEIKLEVQGFQLTSSGSGFAEKLAIK